MWPCRGCHQSKRLVYRLLAQGLECQGISELVDPDSIVKRLANIVPPLVEARAEMIWLVARERSWGNSATRRLAFSVPVRVCRPRAHRMRPPANLNQFNFSLTTEAMRTGTRH